MEHKPWSFSQNEKTIYPKNHGLVTIIGPKMISTIYKAKVVMGTPRYLRVASAAQAYAE